MISNSMEKNFNQLIQLENYSSQLYMALSSYLNYKGLKGMAHWLRLQSEEERRHALKLIDYLGERGGRVELLEVASMPMEFGTPFEAFSKVLEHERYVTNNYNKAYANAFNEQDMQSASFFQTFLDEQVDEEAQSLYIVDKLKMIQDQPAALLIFDEELGRRAG